MGTLSADDKAKYKEIAAAVSKKAGSADAKAALAKTEAAVALINEDLAKQDYDDKIDAKDGVVLGGLGGGGIVSGGALEVDETVYVEEPRIVAEEGDDDDADERSLWGDGTTTLLMQTSELDRVVKVGGSIPNM